MNPQKCCGRREVLGVSGIIVTSALVTGCGSAGERAADAATTNRDAASAASSAAAAPVARTADIPVGGGVIIGSAQAVITQPTAGEFKAFSSVCTHQGCTVDEVEDGLIMCPCHDSEFDIASGAVSSGPANRPLPEIAITVTGDEIFLA